MRERGFTLIELLLVLTLIALLASLVAPVVTGSIGHAKESTLKETLYTLRKAIDDYYADNGSYPADIDVLVQKRYLRKKPIDPITGKTDSWQLVHVEEGKTGKKGIADIHSASEEKSSDGAPYKAW